MTNLQHRQQKIQEKRKHTPWREFVMEIASWFPLNLYKSEGKITRYPISERMGVLTSAVEFVENGSGSMPGLDSIGEDFTESLSSLRQKIEKPRIWTFGLVENCDFADTIGYGSRNCYLTICAGEDIENVLYSFFVITKCENVLNSLGVTNSCSNIYSSSGVTQGFNVYYSRYIYNSSNIWFCSNLQGCSECIFCDNLQNQSYCINNKQYQKEEYFKKKNNYLKDKEQFQDWYSAVNTHSINIGSEDSSGMCVINSTNVENGIFVNQVRNGRNLIICGNGSDISNSYDVISSAMDAYHAYGNMGVSPGVHMYCSMNSGYLDNVYYSVFCQKCSYCFGCFGLIGKSYYIYNKQYSEAEWHTAIDQIFSQMEQDGTLGQFFPPTMNPFYFNDTAAYLIDPTFTKEEVTAKGYLRRDEPIKVDIPAGVQTVKNTELDQFEGYDKEGNRTINDEILKKVILDEEGNAYRVIPMELDFLRKHGLPLPRKHWLERMKENFRIE